MQVKVGNYIVEGVGINKKVVKCNVVENMLEIFGFKVLQVQFIKLVFKLEEKIFIKKLGDGRKVIFFEFGFGDENGIGNKEDEFRMFYLSYQQLFVGIFFMVFEVVQVVGVS